MPTNTSELPTNPSDFLQRWLAPNPSSIQLPPGRLLPNPGFSRLTANRPLSDLAQLNSNCLLTPSASSQRWLAPNPSSSSPLVVSYNWIPGNIYWAASQNGQLISTKNYTAADVPTPGAEIIHINLWLYQANPNVVAGPQNGNSASVLLSNFQFTPY